jgi:hypothetical protein
MPTRQGGDEKKARRGSPKTTMHTSRVYQGHNSQKKKKKACGATKEKKEREKERRHCLIRTDRPMKAEKERKGK